MSFCHFELPAHTVLRSIPWQWQCFKSYLPGENNEKIVIPPPQINVYSLIRYNTSPGCLNGVLQSIISSLERWRNAVSYFHCELNSFVKRDRFQLNQPALNILLRSKENVKLANHLRRIFCFQIVLKKIPDFSENFWETF